MNRPPIEPRAWVGVIRSNHLLLAGVIDAGVSSLATFVAGLYATRTLDPDTLGGYALAFSVFVLSGFVPAQLVFTPTEIAAVEYGPREQLPLLRRSLVRGALVSAFAALATCAWAFVAPASLDPAALVALVVSCAAATFISPIQDHLRRMLHIAGASWLTVVVAGAQITATIAAVIALPSAGVAEAWVPFGALVIANLVSITVGLALSLRSWLAPASDIPVTWGRLLRSGRPLLAAGLIPSTATFIVSWMVSAIAGAATLGYVEAARVVSQPVAVLQIGSSAVLGPRATKASGRGDRTRARRINRQFQGLIVLAGTGWLVVVSASTPWNPLPGLLPNAYVIPGLVAASIIAYTIQSLGQAQRYELYGARREGLVARVEAEGNAARVLIASAAGLLGSFVVPIGLAALGIIRLARYRQGLRTYYRSLARIDPRPGAKDA